MDSGEEIECPALEFSERCVLNLQELVKRIKGRDRIIANCTHSQWLENGRDLCKAKELLPHGHFGEWCERELSYSVRTAQKMMGAAELWDLYAKNESGSHLPNPALMYKLSAPSVPIEIRDAFVPRVMSGENIARELHGALQDYRRAVTAQKGQAEKAIGSSKTEETHSKRDEAKARRETLELERQQIKREWQVTARSSVLTLIVARFGDDMPKLIALILNAGSGSIFTPEAERELQGIAQEKIRSDGEWAGSTGIANEAVSDEISDAPAASKSWSPDPSAVTSSADELSASTPIVNILNDPYVSPVDPNIARNPEICNPAGYPGAVKAILSDNHAPEVYKYRKGTCTLRPIKIDDSSLRKH